MAIDSTSSAYMREGDAFSWYMEADPLLRSTVVSVVVLDGAVDVKRLFERLDRACRITPGFRHKVVQAPLRLARPRWVVDDNFDLAFHVRRIAAPEPGRLSDVFDYACQTGMAGFDRERALWEFTLVEGLCDGRSALVLKLHHALTDGIGGMEMAKNLLDFGAESPRARADAACAHRRPNVAGRARARGGYAACDACRAHDTRLASGSPAHRDARGDEPARDAAHRVRHRPLDRAHGPTRARDPLTGHARARPAWRYDALTFPFDALHDAAGSADCTLNDAFLAALSGGLLRYHDEHGVAVGDLRLTMPISIRKPEDPIGGNRITLVRFRIPASLRDPVERMHAIHELAVQARNEPAIEYTNAIAGALNALPRRVVGSMLKHVDFLASNVPGITVPVYLAGAPVSEWYAFGPTIGSALNATLVSYNGRCFVGINYGHPRDPRPHMHDRQPAGRVRRNRGTRGPAAGNPTCYGVIAVVPFLRPRE